MLVGIELGYIDIDEAYLRVPKSSLRGSREVTVAGADADNQICFFGNPIGSECTSATDCSKAEWVVIAQATLASHCLAYGNACLLNKTLQDIGSFRVNRPAASDDQWLLTAMNPCRCLLQYSAIWSIAWYVPHVLVEERFRIVPRCWLYIL